MLNASPALIHLGITQTSVARAIREVTEIVNQSNPITGAANFIKNVLDIKVKFEDVNVARVTASAVIEAVLKANGQVEDVDALYKAALARALKHINTPANHWMYVTEEEEANSIKETRAFVDGIDTKVNVKADGTIGRGGKQVLAAELFDLHVVNSETPCDNACFVKILITQLGMSKAGARTYAHNLRKEHNMVGA
jgi:hypothetical protein